MSARTAALRPEISLTKEQIADARLLRRAGSSPEAIAEFLDVPQERVERALLAMRTPKADRSRGTLNVRLSDRDFVLREKRPAEAVHDTVHRLIGELEHLRSGL
jgi:hypothetical protein